ncbi:hypothetical protein RCM51_01755, partial [Escherichia coli]|nr:hypothetical protein [Escherichia coli]MED9025306.1 hypothetical protein [Escherichia coli]MED9074598.1 hypothetical protein [Escherichia coli]MED9319063.1 hypothetical protein [Escherichia coli]
NLFLIETEQTIPERRENPERKVKTRNNSMNEFKNDMVDEKSQKGNGSTERANKTPKTQSENVLMR